MPEYLFLVNVANLGRWCALVFGIVVGIPLVAIIVQNAINAFSKPPSET